MSSTLFKIRIEGLHKVEFPQISNNTTLQEALEQFCAKYGLEASEYVLVYVCFFCVCVMCVGLHERHIPCGICLTD